MRSIIIPTDFSAIANNAMNYAIEMAKELDTSITLLHVYQIPVSITEVPIVMASAEDLKAEAEKKLKEVKDSINHVTSGAMKIYTEARVGNIIDELEDFCDKIKPFAVVMGTKGATGIERILFGSTTLTALKHLSFPVIVVPPGSTYKTIKKIGFACDFQKVVETTPIQYIKDIVNEYKAEFHVLNVDYENKHFKPDTPVQSLLLHTMVESLNPEYHFIEHPDIEDGINEFAEKNNLDLLITIPKKHKLLDALFKPSSTKQLVFESHIPIMCVHE
jgi:nucleotide-binding universal stress UspA family protein